MTPLTLLSCIAGLWSPVRISVLFNDRPYRPGETIEAAIQVVSRDRLEISHARAELVCQRRRPRSGELWLRSHETGQSSGSSYVHSAARFCERKTIRAGGEETFSADLPIEETLPAGGEDADLRWKLVITFETLDRRAFSSEQRIRIVPTWQRGQQENSRTYDQP